MEKGKLNAIAADKHKLFELIEYKMPFGKYKNRLLMDIPEYYLVWFKQKGFPQGKLGDMMQQMYEIKLNGLESLLLELKKQYPKP